MRYSTSCASLSTYRDLSSDCETTIYGPYRGLAGKGLIWDPFWIMWDVLFQISSQLMSRKPNMNTAARTPNATKNPILIAFTVFLVFWGLGMGKEQEIASLDNTIYVCASIVNLCKRKAVPG